MGSFAATGGDTTDVVSRLRGYMRNVEAFNALFPQEKVYLHLDNTGYFAGETIWFKAYVVRADKTVATDISRVLYVELVHSSGEVLKSCKVRIENGQASGCLKLDDAFLLSGFYEIRAYTRYMANWDYRGVFSRVIPVFREPEKRGDYSQKKIDLFSYKLRLPNYREQDSTFEEGIGIKFYPEGGKAVRGLPCRMAFRVSEADGTPVDTVVYLMDGEGKVEDTLATVREGCGMFRYLPDGRELYLSLRPRFRKRDCFPLPAASESGGSIYVDAVSSSDTVRLRVRTLRSDTLGLALTHNGNILWGEVAAVSQSGVAYSFPRTSLPGGVSRFTLFDRKGEILADRLVFTRPVPSSADTIRITPLSGQLLPCCPVRLSVSAPPNATFSFSAMDVGSSTGGCHMNPQVWLLLASEVGGYISRPEYYFESGDLEHRRAADLLMMVQGWRRYDWEVMSGNVPFKAKQPVEDSLYLFGRLHRKWRWNPVGGVKLSAYLYNKDGFSLTGHTVTDSTGYYAFSLPDIYGEWNMVFKTQREGKAKSYYVAVDRHFRPLLRRLAAPEMSDFPDVEPNLSFGMSPEGDSTVVVLPRKVIALPEVEVKKKRFTDNARAAWENEINGAHVSNIYYNCDKICDEIADRGEEIPGFDDWLDEKNPFFEYSYGMAGNRIWRYKGHPVRWVLNNNSSAHDAMPIFLDELKSIYICEDFATRRRYGRSNNIHYGSAGISDGASSTYAENNNGTADFGTSGHNSYDYGYNDYNQFYNSHSTSSSDRAINGNSNVTVFLYTHHKFLPNVKGVRRTHFEGYNKPSVFEMDDYSVLPPMEDFRRTLYWNPDVTTDKDGKAVIEFYNNSSCREIQVSAEGITTDGRCIFKK